MAKKTFLQVTNSVLKRLRQGTVATVTETSYSTMIGELVNAAMREAEDAWDWTRLQTTINVTLVAGQTQYAITGAGDRFRMMDDEMWEDTEEYFIRPQTIRYIRKMNRQADITNNDPAFYAFDGEDSNGDPTFSVTPPPQSADTVNVDLIVPTAELSADSDTININWWPIYLRAYALAVSERGEDGGAGFNEIDLEAKNALNDAIAQDAALQRDQLILDVK